MSVRRLRLAAGLALAGSAAAAILPQPALAHALVGRQDLPIPAWLFAWGASLVLIASFALLSVAWRTARLQQERWRPSAAALARLLVNPATEVLAGAIGLGLLVLTVYAGLEGTEDTLRNFSVAFVFVTFWLGVVVLSVLLGDVFRAFNPWRAAARVVSCVFRLVAGQPASAPLKLPERLGCWPAVIGLVGFAWFELIWGAAGVTSGVNPHDTAVAALVYSGITLLGMGLFGIEEWLKRGEAFSVYFGMFATLSVLEVREGRLGRRRFLSGPPSWNVLPGSLAIVLVSIAATSFDGAQEGAIKAPLTSTFNWLKDSGLSGITAFRLANSIWLAIALIVIPSLFWLGIWGMHSVSGSPPVRRLARLFAHTLIPIALAYLVAHYFSLFVYQEQAQFTYLLSDPLGNGSNLFGTASSGINYGVIGANTIWYVQVGALIVGHVTGLTLAHDRAIAIYDDYTKASRSQYFMLAVMVAFTTLGLFLLSQANG
jgi:hypothetical protein